jgi:hypothetical protein
MHGPSIGRGGRGKRLPLFVSMQLRGSAAPLAFHDIVQQSSQQTCYGGTCIMYNADKHPFDHSPGYHILVCKDSLPLSSILNEAVVQSGWLEKPPMESSMPDTLFL